MPSMVVDGTANRSPEDRAEVGRGEGGGRGESRGRAVSAGDCGGSQAEDGGSEEAEWGGLSPQPFSSAARSFSLGSSSWPPPAQELAVVEAVAPPSPLGLREARPRSAASGSASCDARLGLATAMPSTASAPSSTSSMDFCDLYLCSEFIERCAPHRHRGLSSTVSGTSSSASASAGSAGGPAGGGAAASEASSSEAQPSTSSAPSTMVWFWR
mmetsp:Transcript_14202/g.40658  ORF Transcript_14202/g.40658 Transcript_14202/m.40658 type:complete len:213 (+) Transcript_14202:214-852(+)